MKRMSCLPALVCTTTLLFLAGGSVGSAPLHALDSVAKAGKRDAAAKESNANLDAIIREVLRLSGDEEQLAQFPALLQGQLAQVQSTLPPKTYAVLSNAFAEAYRPEFLYAAVVEHFQANGDSKALKAIREWLRTPLAEKMTRLQVEAGTLEAQQQLMEFAAGLEANPPSEARQRLVVRLDETVGVTELGLIVLEATTRAILEGAQASRPPQQRLNPSEIDQTVNGALAQSRGTIKVQTLLTLLFTYRSVSDQELAEYVAFWETDLGRWFSRTQREAYQKALVASAREVGRRVAESAGENATASRSH